MFETWLHREREARGWSNASFNRYHEIGRAAFNWAMRKGHAAGNPFRQIDRLSERGNRRRTEITADQEKGLIEALKQLPARQSHEMRRRLFAAFDCGLRAGEMLRVQVHHVQYGTPDEVWTIELPASITKASEDQRVYVGTKRLKDELLKRRFLDDDSYVFGTERGKFVGSFDRAWQRLFRTAKLPVGRRGGLVWHDLRHEYGIRVAEQTTNIVDVRDMMRHADIRTSERYLKARKKQLKSLASKLATNRNEAL